ncbi:MAG: hypothetical protein PsegKO_17690 [Pseudohongiellaceae bacterium]
MPFSKFSDQQHAVTVHRAHASVEPAVLNSRSFLRHDLAHLAVAMEISLLAGYRDTVAIGMLLASSDINAGRPTPDSGEMVLQWQLDDENQSRRRGQHVKSPK